VPVRIEVLPFVVGTVVIGLILTYALRKLRARPLVAAIAGGLFVGVFGFYFMWFFRDPERVPPSDPAVIVAAADGRIAKITDVSKDDFVKICRDPGLTPEKIEKLGRLAQVDTVRISIFLSLVDVHVNRAPISGTSEFLGYFGAKRYFTFEEKSSTENQHNSIVMSNDKTCCLINQIVGPVARRVVYWHDPDKKVQLKIGDRIGMMKFGSRLDVYFPKDDITIEKKEGDRVAAGTSIVARLKKGP
jgi:phosphatidylserine decarboxylase